MSRPSILFVADVSNWALHTIARFVKQNLSDKYRIYIDFTTYYSWKKRIIRPNSVKGFVHNVIAYNKFVRKYGNMGKYRDTKHNGIYDLVVYLEGSLKNQYMNNISAKKTIKGIYTDIYPPYGYDVRCRDNIDLLIDRYFSDADALICGCQNSVLRYKPYFPNTYFANATHDISLFSRKKYPKCQPFVIGWTGNPSRLDKGYYDIILPAVSLAKKERSNIVLKTKTKGTLKSLAKFYNDVNIVVIASKEDAGPSMFMEASLCGVPAISTSIGWPMEVIKNKINGIIIERDIKQMANAIIEMYDDSKQREMMSNRIRNDLLEILGPDVMINAWETVFKKVL